MYFKLIICFYDFIPKLHSKSCHFIVHRIRLKKNTGAYHRSEDQLAQKVKLQQKGVKSFVPIEQLGEIAVFLAAENATTISGTTFLLYREWSAQ